MLVKLLPQQIADRWDTLRSVLYQVLPPSIPLDESILKNALEAALLDKLHVWMLYSFSNDGRAHTDAIVFTTFVEERITKTRSLLIFALYGSPNGNPKDWFSGLETLRKFARAQGCSSITAYSDVRAAIELAKRLGADVSNRFIILEV